MLIRLTGVDLRALHSALSEVAHGLWDDDVPPALRAVQNELDALLDRTAPITLPRRSTRDELERASFELELSSDEATLGADALDAAALAIGEWEFKTRSGVSHADAARAATHLRAASVAADR